MYQRVHNVEAPPDIPRRLPRGTHGLDPSLVAASQRTRMLEAAGRAVADKGYAATTIEDVVRGAGVSKKTFYEQFTDKLDCFLAAYEAASDELFEHVRAAQDAAHEGDVRSPSGSGGSPADGGTWLARTRAGIHAYLRWLAAEPALARVFLIEVAAAGPEALERRERLRDRYAQRMRELQVANSVPDEIFHAVVAGSDDLVVRRLREGGNLLELEPILLYLQVSLLAGPEAAAELA
ncbi:MAG TPA: TetR/AcrR family transcriptional regulator [Thermoleophilaceae bacterium]|nr:TetR/AcrR family transcriptional regulator [Thermoleophilaceae bacterium]